MKTVLVRLPSTPFQALSLGSADVADDEVCRFLLEKYHLARRSFWLDWRDDSSVSVRLRLLGGKGGFGSNLRAQGNKMSSKKRKIGNEACRDLSGQRIRTVNQNNLIAEYLRKKPELERKRESEIRDKMLKAIEAPNRKPIFSDVAYLRTARETVDMVEAAIYDVLRAGDDSEGEPEREMGNTLESGSEAGPEAGTDVEAKGKDKGKSKSKEKDKGKVLVSAAGPSKREPE